MTFIYEFLKFIYAFFFILFAVQIEDAHVFIFLKPKEKSFIHSFVCLFFHYYLLLFLFVYKLFVTFRMKVFACWYDDDDDNDDDWIFLSHFISLHYTNQPTATTTSCTGDVVWSCCYVRSMHANLNN